VASHHERRGPDQRRERSGLRQVHDRAEVDRRIPRGIRACGLALCNRVDAATKRDCRSRSIARRGPPARARRGGFGRARLRRRAATTSRNGHTGPRAATGRRGRADRTHRRRRSCATRSSPLLRASTSSRSDGIRAARVDRSPVASAQASPSRRRHESTAPSFWASLARHAKERRTGVARVLGRDFVSTASHAARFPLRR
jgi:hypothetical protein